MGYFEILTFTDDAGYQDLVDSYGELDNKIARSGS
jgi:hypothetical protein